MVIGLSQVLVSLSLVRTHSALALVLGAGGWLLISVGFNAYRGRSSFVQRWGDGLERPLFTAAFSLIAGAVTVAAVSVVSGLAWLDTAVTVLAGFAIVTLGAGAFLHTAS